MFKKLLSCLLGLCLMFGQLVVFAEFEDLSQSTQWIQGQTGELTEGSQQEVVDEVTIHLNSALNKALLDERPKSTINALNSLVSEAVVRVDASKATQLAKLYSHVLLKYLGSDHISAKDVQWASDGFISLMGKKVIGIEGINQGEIKYLVGKVVEKNALIQGYYNVDGKNKFNLDEMNEKLLMIEKAHRVTASQLSSIGAFKEIGRELSKKLVLKSSTDGLDVNLSKELVENLVENQMMLVIDENGSFYEIPVDFMKNHIGDFQVKIGSLDLNTIEAYGNSVGDGKIEVVQAKHIQIGYGTNLEPIVVKLPAQGRQALLALEKGYWTKTISDYSEGFLSTEVNGTGIIGLSNYFPTHSDLSGHWSNDNVTSLLARGITSGKSALIYDPDGLMTRGDFVRMLIHIVGSDGKSKNTYSDIVAGSPYADVIESVIYYGFTIGVSGDKFEPDTALTREELVALVAKMHEVKYGYKLSGGFLKFKDMNDIAAYAKESIAAMKEIGYISGYQDNTFRPKNTVTRAEAVSVLYKVLER